MTGGRRLAVFVTAPDETGRMVTFPAGTTVSAEVAKGITNPRAWGEDGESESDDQDAPAPAKKTPAKRAPSSKTEK